MLNHCLLSKNTDRVPRMRVPSSTMGMDVQSTAPEDARCFASPLGDYCLTSGIRQQPPRKD